LEERIYLLDNWYVKANNIMADENISLLEKGNAIGYRMGRTGVIESEDLLRIKILGNDAVDTVHPLAG
jgi:hypothetical protein